MAGEPRLVFFLPPTAYLALLEQRAQEFILVSTLFRLCLYNKKKVLKEIYVYSGEKPCETLASSSNHMKRSQKSPMGANVSKSKKG